MIAADRDLLVRLRQVNERISTKVVEVVGNLDPDAHLPAPWLEDLADELGDVATRLRSRASEVGHVIDAAP